MILYGPYGMGKSHPMQLCKDDKRYMSHIICGTLQNYIEEVK